MSVQNKKTSLLYNVNEPDASIHIELFMPWFTQSLSFKNNFTNPNDQKLVLILHQ